MKKLLIIEDNPKHLQDAKNFFSTIEGVDVTYQESYEPFSFMTRMNTLALGDDFKKYDGVISDIYFPEKPGKETQPIGVSVMFQCKVMNVPCVLCTDGYHHGQHYAWIHEMVVAFAKFTEWKGVPYIVDSMNGKEKLKEKGKMGEEVTTKGWAKAWEELQNLF